LFFEAVKPSYIGCKAKQTKTPNLSILTLIFTSNYSKDLFVTKSGDDYQLKERFLIHTQVLSKLLRKAKSRALFWLWTKYLVLQFVQVQICHVNLFFSDKNCMENALIMSHSEIS
jgi:hypothetical protein